MSALTVERANLTSSDETKSLNIYIQVSWISFNLNAIPQTPGALEHNEPQYKLGRARDMSNKQYSSI